MIYGRISGVEKDCSKLALGCWAFGKSQWGGQEDDDSREAMQAAYDCGMTHFDTAAAYGGGHSELVVGEFIKDKRDRIFLASKGNATDGAGITAQIEKSLERLQTDVIDLYYIHWPRQGFDVRPVMAGLAAAKEEGKIRAIGVSNFGVDHLEAAAEVCDVAVNQILYNMIWRFPEQDLIPYCREKGIGIVTYSSIAQGALTGKFPRHPEFKDGDSRGKTVTFEPDVWPHVYEGVEELKALAGELGRTPAHLAIRWVAQKEGVASVLLGARNAQQVRDNASAGDGEIPAAAFVRMDEIGDKVMSFMPDAGNLWRYCP